MIKKERCACRGNVGKCALHPLSSQFGENSKRCGPHGILFSLHNFIDVPNKRSCMFLFNFSPMSFSLLCFSPTKQSVRV